MTRVLLSPLTKRGLIEAASSCVALVRPIFLSPLTKRGLIEAAERLKAAIGNATFPR